MPHVAGQDHDFVAQGVVLEADAALLSEVLIIQVCLLQLLLFEVLEQLFDSLIALTEESHAARQVHQVGHQR